MSIADGSRTPNPEIDQDGVDSVYINVGDRPRHAVADSVQETDCVQTVGSVETLSR
jgi:hypothetical protein